MEAGSAHRGTRTWRHPALGTSTHVPARRSLAVASIWGEGLTAPRMTCLVVDMPFCPSPEGSVLCQLELEGCRQISSQKTPHSSQHIGAGLNKLSLRMCVG